MKSLQEIYDEIMANDELKQEFVQAMKNGEVREFLEQRDCNADAEEIREFLETKAGEDAPISLSAEELEEVAGGSLLSHTCGCSLGDTCGCSNTCVMECC